MNSSGAIGGTSRPLYDDDVIVRRQLVKGLPDLRQEFLLVVVVLYWDGLIKHMIFLAQFLVVAYLLFKHHLEQLL